MSKWIYILLAAAALLLSFQKTLTDPETIHVSEGWPEPVYNKPITENGFQLGKKLFYDPKLSRDGSTSCANCHLSFTGFTHVDHKVSHGIDDRTGTRNSPVLINLAWNSSFHWDGGVNHLEMQMINPIQHPKEMDNTLENVISYLNSETEYRALFFDAFGDSTATTPNMLRAFGQFTASLISSNAKFDQVMRGEAEFTEQEQKGYKLFQMHCNSCHKAPLFNSNFFSSNGLAIDTAFNDVGRYAITKIGADSLQFRIPTLRNIEFTRPYMHDGRFETLREVLEHYTSIDTEAPYLSKQLRTKIDLKDTDKKDLIAFLKTLTDKEFLYNPRFRP